MSRHVQMWCVLGGLLLGCNSSLAAEEPVKKSATAVPAEKARRKNDAAGSRNQNSPPANASSRYQMLKAGERVVILDTQTGETRIIEPERPGALQNVQVGKAWVVVTVLGNASLRSRPLPLAPHRPEN